MDMAEGLIVMEAITKECGKMTSDMDMVNVSILMGQSNKDNGLMATSNSDSLMSIT